MLSGSAMAVTLLAALAFAAQQPAKPPGPAADPQIGQSFQVPFRLTDTNHFLVRVRLNGKGPFNFLVDSGAPSLYIATETAKKVGLKPDPDEFWTPSIASTSKEAPVSKASRLASKIRFSSWA